jgi:hypothetical protein
MFSVGGELPFARLIGLEARPRARTPEGRRLMPRHRTLLLLIGLIALAVLGCGDSGDDNGTNNPPPTPSITANNQTISPADHVVVAKVVSDGPGWAVIHEQGAKSLGAAIGHAAAPDGTTQNLSVELDRNAEDGETLFAVLHIDAGAEGTYEFPGADVPETDKDGDTVAASFRVTVSQGLNPAITVQDQTLSGLSTVVTVPSAVSAGAGWVVIHEDNAGSPGPVIGYTAVPSGTSTEIIVALDRPAADAETLHAMLHVDAGVVGTYEFPGSDVPAFDQDEVMVVKPFTVDVPAGTPAIRLRVTGIGFTAYDFTAVEPSRYASTVGAENENQPLTLRSGWRYEIVNSAPTIHPFEIIHVGANPASDIVLFSQGASGSLEADVSVAWFDDGDQTLRFTVSAALQSNADGYRCLAHPTTMRGDVGFE